MGLPLSEQTLTEALKQADDKSVAIEKWHLGAHPTQSHLAREIEQKYFLPTNPLENVLFRSGLLAPHLAYISLASKDRATKLLKKY